MSRSAPATSTAQKEEAWRERIARQRASGKTIAAFCEEENLGKSTFSYWRRRLGVAPVATRVARKRTAQAAPFLDLGPIKAVICFRAALKDRSPMAVNPPNRMVRC